MLVKALTVLKAKQHTFLHEALCRPSHRSLLLTKLYAVWFGISNRVFSVFGFCSYTRHNNVPLKCRQNHYTETENNKSPDRDEIQHLYLGGTTSPTGSTPPAGYMRRQLTWRGLSGRREIPLVKRSAAQCEDSALPNNLFILHHGVFAQWERFGIPKQYEIY